MAERIRLDHAYEPALKSWKAVKKTYLFLVDGIR